MRLQEPFFVYDGVTVESLLLYLRREALLSVW